VDTMKPIANIVRAAGFSVVLTSGILTAAAALADPSSLATPGQRRACTPDVYRLCAAEIPNPRAITACLRRKRTNLSDACRAVFEQ